MDVNVVAAVQSIVEATFTSGEHLGTLETGEVKADLERIKTEP